MAEAPHPQIKSTNPPLVVVGMVRDTMSKLVYVGDCITGLEDQSFCSAVASDATELGQIVDCDNEDVEHPTPSKFVELVEVLPQHQHYLEMPGVSLGSPELGYNAAAGDCGVAWIWDEETDTHYFYA